MNSKCQHCQQSTLNSTSTNGIKEMCMAALIIEMCFSAIDCRVCSFGYEMIQKTVAS
ncbi:unnamed protein product, partial [Callosobruchus maculatus]